MPYIETGSIAKLRISEWLHCMSIVLHHAWRYLSTAMGQFFHSQVLSDDFYDSELSINVSFKGLNS